MMHKGDSGLVLMLCTECLSRIRYVLLLEECCISCGKSSTFVVILHPVASLSRVSTFWR